MIISCVIWGTNRGRLLTYERGTWRLSRNGGNYQSALRKQHWKAKRSIIIFCMLPIPRYEGWNFNFGNAAVTFDTAHLQSSYFHRPSMSFPKLCRTRSQRWGSRMIPLAAPVLLMVRTEQSTAEGLNPPCNCPIRQWCRTASLFQSSVTLLLFCPCLLQF